MTDELSSSLFFDIRKLFLDFISAGLDSAGFKLFVLVATSESIGSKSSSLAGSIEDEVDDEDNDDEELSDIKTKLESVLLQSVEFSSILKLKKNKQKTRYDKNYKNFISKF